LLCNYEDICDFIVLNVLKKRNSEEEEKEKENHSEPPTTAR